jgi:hypothetical protein
MRHKLSLVFIALILASALGCAAKKPVPAPLPPGAINQFDATSFRILSDAQAAINSVKSDITAGKITPSEDEKKVLNQIIADYNTANDLYQSYHSGATTDTAGLSKAVNQLVVDIAAVSSQLQGGKK